jgi:hypothetical protein
LYQTKVYIEPSLHYFILDAVDLCLDIFISLTNLNITINHSLSDKFKYCQNFSRHP